MVEGSPRARSRVRSLWACSACESARISSAGRLRSKAPRAKGPRSLFESHFPPANASDLFPKAGHAGDDLETAAMKRILLIDDHEVVRSGVKRIFDKQPSGEVVFGEASTPQDARHLVREREWDVAVLDPSLGGRDGQEGLKEMKQSRPRH